MENVKVTVEEQSSVKRKMAVEVPTEEVDGYFRDTFREYRRQVALPGFRKGKVPRQVIESRFQGDVTQDVTRRILQDSYGRALDQTGLKPVSEPNISDLQIEQGKPFVFKAEFEVVPSFEVKDYLGIELENREVEVKDEEVDAILEKMRTGQATLTKIAEDRGLRTGDVAMIDFEGVSDGEPIPGGSAKDFPLTIGSDTFLPGFEDSLVGATPGEEREFFLKLPDEFQEKKMAGKEAGFKVLLKEIRERALPDLNDDFAKDVGDYESLEELRGRIRIDLRTNKEASAKGDLREKLVEALLEADPFEVPSAMVQHRRAMMLASVERNMVLSGVNTEEIKKNRDRIYEETAVPAERKVRATLILEAIAEKEKVEITGEEVNAEIRKIAEQNKTDPGEVRRKMVENDSLDDLEGLMREEKTIDFLLEKARVHTVAPTDEAPAEKGKDQK